MNVVVARCPDVLRSLLVNSMAKLILIRCEGIGKPINDVLLLGSRKVSQSGCAGDIKLRKMLKHVFQHIFHASVLQVFDCRVCVHEDVLLERGFAQSGVVPPPK